MFPLLDPDVKIPVVSGYSLACVPLSYVKELENLSATSRKPLNQVVAQILTLVMPEISKRVLYELSENQDQLDAEMRAKLELRKPENLV